MIANSKKNYEADLNRFEKAEKRKEVREVALKGKDLLKKFYENTEEEKVPWNGTLDSYLEMPLRSREQIIKSLKNQTKNQRPLLFNLYQVVEEAELDQVAEILLKDPDLTRQEVRVLLSGFGSLPPKRQDQLKKLRELSQIAAKRLKGVQQEPKKRWHY